MTWSVPFEAQLEITIATKLEQLRYYGWESNHSGRPELANAWLLGENAIDAMTILCCEAHCNG